MKIWNKETQSRKRNHNQIHDSIRIEITHILKENSTILSNLKLLEFNSFKMSKINGI